jgi:hydrogenase maturation protease
VKPTIAIGLGNPLLSDEGVGVRLAQTLLREADHFPEVDFLDGASAGMALLHVLAGRQKGVFLDCSLMGAAPGDIRRFLPEEVVSRKTKPNFSMHEGDLLDIIALSRKLGECPPTIVIFGIEPASLAPGDTLSAPLQARWDEYLRIISAELRDTAK